MILEKKTMEVMSANAHAVEPIEIIDQLIRLAIEGKAWSKDFGILVVQLVMYLINRAIDDMNSPDGLIAQQKDDQELVEKLTELTLAMGGEDAISSWPKSGSLPFFYKLVLEFLLSKFLEWLATNVDKDTVESIKALLYAWLEKFLS